MFVLLLLYGSAAPAAVYYVATVGNDANNGSSVSPWRTIQKAANTIVAGDIVRVRLGVYAERVAESTSGTSGNLITYLAENGVTVLGFNITGNYVRVVGFEITHSTALGYAGITVTGDFCQLLDNNIHNTSGTSIDPSAANFLTIRGNVLNYSGSPGGPSGSGLKSINDGGGSMTNVLVEYNHISHTTDYLCSNGTNYVLRNNVLGPTIISDFGGAPHTDGWQSNAQTRNGLMEANWHVDNAISDSHIFLSERPVNGRNAHYTLIKNVSLRSGDQLWAQFRDATNHLLAHNTVGQVGFGPRGGPGGSGFVYVWSDGNGPSTGNQARNNAYTNVTRGAVYTVNSGSSLLHDHDLVYPPSSDLANGVNGDREVDPQFANYAINDVRPKAASPMIDAGGALTTASNSGNSARVIALARSADAYWFNDGFNGMIEGHKVYVGNNNNLTVIGRDVTAGTITVANSISWTVGDKIGYAYRGSGPDIGAYEFGDVPLTAATISKASDTYTVTCDGDVRFVVFYVDGIPQAPDYLAPFVFTSAGTVTAKAFALHAQASPVIAASAGTASRPTVPQGVQFAPTN